MELDLVGNRGGLVRDEFRKVRSSANPREESVASTRKAIVYSSVCEPFHHTGPCALTQQSTCNHWIEMFSGLDRTSYLARELWHHTKE